MSTPGHEGVPHGGQRADPDRRDADVLPFPSLGRTAPTAPAHEPKLREVVGDVLRDERRRQERTLADVAREAAVSVTHLSDVERGTTEASSDVLDAICRALELPLREVLDRGARRLGSGPSAGTTMLLAA